MLIYLLGNFFSKVWGWGGGAWPHSTLRQFRPCLGERQEYNKTTDGRNKIKNKSCGKRQKSKEFRLTSTTQRREKKETKSRNQKEETKVAKEKKGKEKKREV